jgi:hypothetical protein
MEAVAFLIFAGALEKPPPYFVEYPQNVEILHVLCNRYPDLALDSIERCIDRYQDRVLKDFLNLGILLRLERGHIQIGPALKHRHPSAESAYYLAAADRRKNRGWVTIKRDRQGVNEDINALERLLEGNASEREMHRFFEQHPAILMQAMGGIPQSHRPTFTKPKKMQPDYAITPILGPIGTDRPVVLLEMKGPSESILTKGLHRGFAAKVHHAVDQVRDYNRYLRDPSNKEAITQSLGYVPTDSNLAVLIGRAPRRDSDLETFVLRQAELDVKVVTYDEILQVQSNQMS